MWWITKELCLAGCVCVAGLGAVICFGINEMHQTNNTYLLHVGCVILGVFVCVLSTWCAYVRVKRERNRDQLVHKEVMEF